MNRKQQNLIAGPIEGYKICNEDMTCRRVRFEIGKRTKLPNDDPLELCKNGFHFCKHQSGVWNYYDEGRIFKVRAYGVLVQDIQPGTSYKLVCEEIELYEEILIGEDTGDKNIGSWNIGDSNTGSWNIGDKNTGNSNTGCWNTGSWNIGYWNAGNRNTGNWNVGSNNTGDNNIGNWNVGNRNVGDSNIGNRNIGDRNVGDKNIGDGNAGDSNIGDSNIGSYHSGYFGLGEAPVYMFGKPTKVKRCELDLLLVSKLGEALQSNELFDISPFLALPNATEARIKKLHKAWIAHRKSIAKGEDQ